ncbi:MAG: hypothetical protein Q7S55_04485 [Nanoarchaeota archaeon]|nr:hypothetical protein [Nanoarchaeota archaeon]
MPTKEFYENLLIQLGVRHEAITTKTDDSDNVGYLVASLRLQEHVGEIVGVHGPEKEEDKLGVRYITTVFYKRR